jgi:hypothetical protein
MYEIQWISASAKMGIEVKGTPAINGYFGI